MRWSGPWKAESGIRPGSRNNILIFFFFSSKRRLPQRGGRRRGLHPQCLTLADLRAPCGGIRNYPACGNVTVEPHLEQIKKHTKRTGAFLSKVAFCVFFYEAPPSTLCAQGGFRALECDVFGHLQRLQFFTGRLMTPFVIIILMVLVLIMFVFRFSLRKQPPPLFRFQTKVRGAGCF